MKTILFISPTGTLDNGAERSIVQLMALLKKQGHIIINVAQSNNSSDRKEYQSEMDRLGIPFYTFDLLKWWWPDAPGGEISDMELATTQYRDVLRQLQELIRNLNINLVVSNTVNVFLGAIAASISQIPHFWLVHEFPDNEFSYYKTKLPFIVENSSKIFAVEGNLREHLQSIVPNRTIHGFVPYTILESKNELLISNKHRFISIGRLSDRKNQLELIKAYRHLGRFDIELCFIGPWDNKYKELCDNYIDKYELKNIRFLGYQEKPWELVSNLDICIFPSKMETFGLVYIESVLNGVPVIASDNLGHQTVQRLFNLPALYPSTNIKELSDQMQKTLANFYELKENSLRLKEKIRVGYNPELAYQEILKFIVDEDIEINSNLDTIDFLLTTSTRKTKLEVLGRKISHKLTNIRHKFR